MKSIIVRASGGTDVLELADSPSPEPGVRQVRVKVVASSLNPIDLSARAGRLTAGGLMPPMSQYGLGWDVAGHVDALGPRATRFHVGDPVIGLRDLLFAGGTHAEYVVLDESALAPAPASVPLTHAATLPLNALTADRALDLAGVKAGQTLLVTGASGGVGGFALELAKLRGVRTIALARPSDADRVRAIASQVVTSSDDLGPAVRRIVPGGVDAVIDAAVLGITAHQALRSAGTFVALVAPFAPPPIRGTRVVVQEVFADGGRLAELARLVDDGTLTLRVAHTFPLTQAREAHELLEKGGIGGRIILTP
ncbi:NADP-dependent oxidoreductase [Actinoplanes derwentensis]|uniref:NADPH:quinone reductase n=1 Tax=Actinoplanes derwentensis TaxID=113562 RepID=A0A1H2D788_9ACTN|nr:NADP-dependent oxidoreductase [Actinoplanes derwentensis]GID85566.1 NADPH:quinone reductase [Actinoplanes derwentensis]SDT78332.1 NADPH:quinone reductase [Actinoplanes derwentensis]